LIGKIQHVDDILRKFPAMVVIGPACVGVLESIFGPDKIENADSQALLRIISPTSVYPPMEILSKTVRKLI
jgi:hypothetical protein